MASRLVTAVFVLSYCQSSDSHAKLQPHICSNRSLANRILQILQKLRYLREMICNNCWILPIFCDILVYAIQAGFKTRKSHCCKILLSYCLILLSYFSVMVFSLGLFCPKHHHIKLTMCHMDKYFIIYKTKFLKQFAWSTLLTNSVFFFFLKGYAAEMESPLVMHLLSPMLHNKKDVLFGNMEEIYHFHNRSAFYFTLSKCYPNLALWKLIHCK